MAHVAVLSPALAVMVADPAATPVTRPPATVATPLSDELQVTVLSVALSGVTVAVSVTVAPTASCALPGETVMPVTATSSEGSLGLGLLPSSPGFVHPARMARPMTGIASNRFFVIAQKDYSLG